MKEDKIKEYLKKDVTPLIDDDFTNHIVNQHLDSKKVKQTLIIFRFDDLLISISSILLGFCAIVILSNLTSFEILSKLEISSEQINLIILTTFVFVVYKYLSENLQNNLINII